MTTKTALTKNTRAGKNIVVTVHDDGNIIITVDGKEKYQGPNLPTSPAKEIQEKLDLDPMAGVYGPVILTGPEIELVRKTLAEVHPESRLQQLLNRHADLSHQVTHAKNQIPQDLPQEAEFFKTRDAAISTMNELSQELVAFENQHPQMVERISQLRTQRLERSRWN